MFRYAFLLLRGHRACAADWSTPGGAAPSTPGPGRVFATDSNLARRRGTQKIDALEDRMTTRAQKKAKRGKGDEGTEAKIDKGEAFSESVLQNLYCPITHQLFVDPHTAEDGNVYEKAAIECWLTSKQRSPVTNEPMGARLFASSTMRALVESVLENKVVDADTAAAWYLESAKAKATGEMPLDSQIVSIEEHLSRAEKLSPSEEIKAVRDAIELKSEMDDWILEMQARTEDLEKEKQALLEKSPESVTDAVAAILGPVCGSGQILEWRELREGKAKIRIIDDAEELERLCKRKAPGAAIPCEWHEQKNEACGKVFVVQRNRPNSRGYAIIRHNGCHWHIPFDACRLVAY